MIFSGEDRRKVRYEKAKTEDTTYEKSKIDPHGMYLPYTLKLTLSAIGKAFRFFYWGIFFSHSEFSRPLLSSMISHDTLRERILTGGGGAVPARGSLAKVAGRYADFLRSLRQRPPREGGDGGDGGEDAGAPAAAPAAVTARALETELRLYDLEVRKSALSYRARNDDSSRCASALKSLEGRLSSVRSEVDDLKGELVRERAARRRREEYDALARMGTSSAGGGGDTAVGGGSSLPPVRATRMELEDVRREMARVEGEMERARWELTVRERQLRVVMASLGDLGATLREEETRRGGAMTAGGRRRGDDDDDDDEGGGGGADASTSSTTKSTQRGSKRRRSIEDGGGDFSDDGDNHQDDCGAI